MENKVPKSSKSQSTSRIQSSKAHKPTKSKSTSALPKNQARSKNDNYKIVSKSSILHDFKNTAVHSLANVKNRINSLSALLKHSKKSQGENYTPIDEHPTPIKLYSPFNFIESPEPLKISEKTRIKLRQQLFVSPTNQIQEDVAHLEIGIEELKFISRKAETNYQFKQQLCSSTDPFQANAPIASKSASFNISTRLIFDEECSLI